MRRLKHFEWNIIFPVSMIQAWQLFLELMYVLLVRWMNFLISLNSFECFNLIVLLAFEFMWSSSSLCVVFIGKINKISTLYSTRIFLTQRKNSWKAIKCRHFICVIEHNFQRMLIWNFRIMNSSMWNENIFFSAVCCAHFLLWK